MTKQIINPKKKKVRVSWTIREEVVEEVDNAAEKYNVSSSAAAEELLEEGLEQLKKEEKK